MNLGQAWIRLGVSSLLISGILSAVITFAKLPIFAAWLPDPSVTRWLLVVHVNLATLVWFTAIPLGMSLLANEKSPSIGTPASWNKFLLFMAVTGIALFLTAFPSDTAKPIMSNYIPVVTHERHLLGLALYILSVVGTYFSHAVLTNPVVPAQVRFGTWLGATYIVLAVVNLAHLLNFHVPNQLTTLEARIDHLMWGPGHLLQHSSAIFLAVAWIRLLGGENTIRDWGRRRLFWIFSWMGLPIFVVPWLMSYSIDSHIYREGFTSLMRWGIIPPLAVLAFGLWRYAEKSSAQGLAFRGSCALLFVGTFFGIMIRGSDMRIPGHYHASIGAITLVFMALAWQLLQSNPSVNQLWVRRAIRNYTWGQIVFSSGMFLAGWYGLGRKTYGSEHLLTLPGVRTGIALMLGGGLVTLVAGVLFARAILPSLLKPLLIKTRRFHEIPHPLRTLLWGADRIDQRSR